MNATVKDVMTTPAVAVRMSASFQDMAVRLREQRISGFPGLGDDNRVVVAVRDRLSGPPREPRPSPVSGLPFSGLTT